MATRVLVVEDEQTLLKAYSITLTRAGFDVLTAADGEEALLRATEAGPEVLVCDFMLPKRNGLEVLAALRARDRDAEFVLLTAYASLDTAVEALRLGANDFVTKPVSLELLIDRVRRAEARVHMRRALGEANEKLRGALAEAKRHYLGTARILGGVLDLYDPAQGGHAKRVASLATSVARAAGLEEDEIAHIEVAAVLHDIGYLALPPGRARKPTDELTSGEQLVVREHPGLGETLLGGPDGGAAARLVRHHHEQWDGGGFPDRIAGDAIPFGARILAVCEAYDEALSWPAPGATASPALATEQLRRGRGRQFDPEVVDFFLEVEGRAVHSAREVAALTVAKLEEGMVLARAVHTVNGLLLLPEGQVLTRAHVERIRNFHQVHPLGDRIYVYRPPA